ncbi:MAG TPA: MFS transporter [Burkholderiales bacterium]|nr:MFS transporter [Burkholderiales bacterium]
MRSEFQNNNPGTVGGVDSPYAWTRLVLTLVLSTVGGVGMWSVVVALPAIQAEFGIARAQASLPYTLTMCGFGVGGILLGKMSDRRGIVPPVLIGMTCLIVGYAAAASASTLWQYSLAHIVIGFGSSATFSPLLAETSHWFARRRGIAVGIIASGNYLAGTIWPPVIQHFIESAGWRQTFSGIAVFCLATMLPLALTLRRRAPAGHDTGAVSEKPEAGNRPLGLSPRALQNLLMIASIGCCVAMSMPQVHLVAYCGDLGYGAARGAQMLSVMLACGIVSRLTFGWISDRIGGLRTLLIGSGMQCVALLLFLPFDGLASLFIISALFGLFQGGIVPSYAMIIREYFSPKEAGARIGIVITASLVGMAFGGWMSGVIFDFTGSYRIAFLNGIAWNLVNMAIAVSLLNRSLRWKRQLAGA